jgi:hypothetical protein
MCEAYNIERYLSSASYRIGGEIDCKKALAFNADVSACTFTADVIDCDKENKSLHL